MPSSKRHQSRFDHEDVDHSSDDDLGRRKNQPRGYRPPIQREDSLVKTPADHRESDWDTDYNPRSKYYLSSDDDDDDDVDDDEKHPHFRSPGSKSPPRSHGSRQRGGSWDRRSPSKHRGPERGGASRKEPSHPRSHAHSRLHSPSRSHSHTRERDEKSSHSRPRDHEGSHSRPRGDKDGPPRKHKATTADDSSRLNPAPGSHASRSRPKPSRPKPPRAPSSYHTGSRPRPTRAASSYTHSASRSSRPRPVRGLSHNSGQTKPKPKPKPKIPKDLARLVGPEGVGELSKMLEDFPWQEAGKVAMQAGTVAGTYHVPLSSVRSVVSLSGQQQQQQQQNSHRLRTANEANNKQLSRWGQTPSLGM